MRYVLCVLYIFIVFPVWAGQKHAVGDTIQGKVWVIDGDSIRLTHADYTKSEVRIFGIDAPEYNTATGKQALYFLINTVKSGNRTATCTIIDIDTYNRYVSQCMLHTHSGDIDIGLHMLQNNHAAYYGRYMHLESVPKGLQQAYEKYSGKG